MYSECFVAFVLALIAETLITMIFIMTTVFQENPNQIRNFGVSNFKASFVVNLSYQRLRTIMSTVKNSQLNKCPGN